MDFGNLYLDNTKVREIHKIEQLNNWKINLHVRGDKSLTIRCNDKSVVIQKAVNISLLCHQGSQYFFGIVTEALVL